LYVAQNKPDLARDLLSEVERSNPYSSLGAEAGWLLEQVNAKFPKATPTVTPLTNAPVKPDKK
jgi:hypothetical protein